MSKIVHNFFRLPKSFQLKDICHSTGISLRPHNVQELVVKDAASKLLSKICKTILATEQ
jgi:hypothetical protein